MNWLTEFVKESLPTPWSRRVATATATISLALFVVLLPQWWQNIGLEPQQQPELLTRLLILLAILFFGTLITLAIVVRDYNFHKNKQQIPTDQLPKKLIQEQEHLEPIQEKILSFVAQSPRKPAKEIARPLGITEPLAEYHLNVLRNCGYIKELLAVGQPSWWIISQEGRAYLVKNNLPI